MKTKIFLEEEEPLLTDIRFRSSIRGWNNKDHQSRTQSLLNKEDERMLTLLRDDKDILRIPRDCVCETCRSLRFTFSSFVTPILIHRSSIYLLLYHLIINKPNYFIINKQKENPNHWWGVYRFFDHLIINFQHGLLDHTRTLHTLNPPAS